MELMIFDESGKKVDVLQNYTSIQWHRYYASTGSFEIHVNPTKTNVEYLQKGMRLVKQNTRDIGFISYSVGSEKDGDSQEEDIEIRGYLDNLNDRINTKTCHFGTNIETDVNSCITANKRNLDINLSTPKGIKVDIDIESTWQTLRDTVKIVCDTAGLGYRMYADKYAGKDPTKLNLFELYQGQVRKVKFSDKLSNITFQSIERNYQNYKNVAYVCAQGQGVERTVVEVDLSNGGERYEMYVDSRNTSKEYVDEEGNSHTYTDTEYKKILYDEGLENLSQYTAIEKFSITVDPLDPLFKFREDYDLGDIVTVESVKYNIRNELYRISGILEIDENGTESVQIELTRYEDELVQAKKGVIT